MFSTKLGILFRELEFSRLSTCMCVWFWNVCPGSYFCLANRVRSSVCLPVLEGTCSIRWCFSAWCWALIYCGTHCWHYVLANLQSLLFYVGSINSLPLHANMPQLSLKVLNIGVIISKMLILRGGSINCAKGFLSLLRDSSKVEIVHPRAGITSVVGSWCLAILMRAANQENQQKAVIMC